MTTRTALTTNARRAITTAATCTADNGDRVYFITNVITMAAGGTDELLHHGLVVDLGAQYSSMRRYQLTEAGVIVRTKLQHRQRINHLANDIRRYNVDGEELADIAASIGAGEEDYVGNVQVHVAMALVASLAPMAPGRPLGCSAEDIRQEVETVLGWND